jgi:hypothetical protein
MSRVIKLGFAGVTVLGLGRLAAAGRLPRNLVAGIRLPSTLHSDEAWRAGHRAAASALTVSGLGPIVVAVLVGARKPDDDTEGLLLRLGRGWLLGCWLGLATIQARRAARSTYVA